ncbi:replication protein [Lactiplantibacillus plantarum]|uniref:replication protein n=1 Tax=Lactiplantibacillus plantarum TaxID=1590 RepID=UPI001B53FF5B|nr:replication protein [Lactiplantibacillus plantarum]MBP5842137.1 replication protein [Lactiplantibacillus plantarum]UNB86155.1 replication protein [Lactiplantibacillus plantarum]
MAKDKRSSKWTLLMYRESAPEDYLEVLNEMQVPYILSPWHDKDINTKTGELKKGHKHGALFFESLKSYTQVSEMVSDRLNGPPHVEVVMSPKGMYNYFTHAENPEKTLYDVDDIESGAGFEIEKFLVDQEADTYMNDVVDIIEDNDFTEFKELVYYARNNDYILLSLIVDHTFFFSKYLDSRRCNPKRTSNSALENNVDHKNDESDK